jgi:hypothetical protein
LGRHICEAIQETEPRLAKLQSADFSDSRSAC